MKDNEKLKSIIYISKRCEHCRKLLLLLKQRPELKGTIQIVSIDDEPFPNIIKSVPSMVSDGELWNANELFAVLEGRKLNQNQDQEKEQPHQEQNMQSETMNQTSELDAYFEGGSTLGYAMLDNSMDTLQYASSNLEDEKMIHNEGNNSYINKKNKASAFDNDYEKMMEERNSVQTLSRA